MRRTYTKEIKIRALKMFYYEGKGKQKIADELGIPFKKNSQILDQKI